MCRRMQFFEVGILSFQKTAVSDDWKIKLVHFQISCRILFTIQLRYLRLSSYTWMLSEGWYLHRLLIAAFAAPKSLRNYHIVCWGKCTKQQLF